MLAKQIRLLPAGCQPWYSNAAGSKGSHFAFASTLATFVFSTDDMRLKKLCAVHERTITSVVWCPNDGQVLATSGMDKKVYRWHVGEERIVASLSTEFDPVQLDWCQQDRSIIAVLSAHGNVYLWTGDGDQIQPIAKLQTGTITSIRWNCSSSAARLACGTNAGLILVWTMATDQLVRIESGTSAADAFISDLQWDPLSNEYVLALAKGGVMSLVDTTKGVAAMDFERQNTEAVSALFVQSSPGTFMTVGPRIPFITEWNVSQKTPFRRIRLPNRSEGAFTIKGMDMEPFLRKQPSTRRSIQRQDSSTGSTSTTPAAVASSSQVLSIAGANSSSSSGATAGQDATILIGQCDGSVSLLDSSGRKVIFSTSPAHSETIFDCRFSPNNPDLLATASYDGRIMFWNTVTAQSTASVSVTNQAIYSISWAPQAGSGGQDENRIAASSSSGQVYVWDSKTCVQRSCTALHKKPSFRLSWNPYHPDMIASTSSDGDLIVSSSSGDVIRKVTHPAAAFGVDWSPFAQQQQRGFVLCTGCADGVVRIISMEDKQIVELKGHGCSVFNTVWSPLVEDCLASGADDGVVRVWNTATGASKALVGHTNKVRALLWHTEIPWLLISGSWDSSIRLWDIRNGECLQTIACHQADVYGLHMHAQRPFLFISTSRDNSIRYWSLESLVAKLELQALCNRGIFPNSCISTVEGGLNSKAALLCGKWTESLIRAPPSNLSIVGHYARMFILLKSSPGIKDLWRLVKRLAPSHMTTNSNSHNEIHELLASGGRDMIVPHFTQLHDEAKAEAKSLESIRPASSRGKASEQLEAAAALNLKMGNLRQYCEIMVKLEKYWEKALAVAPGVSLQYWKELTEECSRQILSGAGSMDECLPLLTASGDSATIVDQFYMSGQLRDAMIVAVCHNQSKQPTTAAAAPDASSYVQTTRRTSIGPMMIDTTVTEVTPAVRGLTNQRAEQHMQNGDAVLAACMYLAIDDIAGALQCLRRGFELELVFAVAECLKQKHDPWCIEALAFKSEAAGLWKEARYFWSLLSSGGSYAISMLQWRCPKEELVGAGMVHEQSLTEQSLGTIRSRKIDSLDAAVEWLCMHIASGENSAAIEGACRWITKEIADDPRVLNLRAIGRLVAPLHHIALHTVPAAQRHAALALINFVGAHTAIARGFGSVVSFLVQNAIDLCQRCNGSGIALSLPLFSLKIHELQFMAHWDPNRAVGLARELVASKAPAVVPPEDELVKVAAAILQRLCDGQYGVALKRREQMSRGAIIPTGSVLLSGMRSKFQCVSIMSRKPIMGARYILDDGGTSMNVTEAAEWVLVNPFSPLNTGVRMQLNN